ncbi:glycoside hydrolase family 104 protein [uncultured Aquitalea sp.]|uniref:glycoside hydrolase family 24 protein n=1 Tax=uncultured Aquitalea sp. TaxID=540272 RepID=UPI0025F4EF39|nr:glycoside hydrolase family 104 protein [uncultured Aquitalea sp.]
MARISAGQAGGQNVVALLDTVAISEIGPATLHGSDDGYNVLVGSTPGHILTFPSYADHPNIYNKSLNSTAAGRYQQLHLYWPHYKALLKLPDFGPISQDTLAIQLFKEQGALTLIQAGDFAGAINKIKNIWASMPGSKYGQHTNSLDYLTWAYKQAGGVINGAA